MLESLTTPATQASLPLRHRDRDGIMQIYRYKTIFQQKAVHEDRYGTTKISGWNEQSVFPSAFNSE